MGETARLFELVLWKAKPTHERSGASVDTAQIGQAYALAVGVSCSIAVGARKLVESGPPWVKRLGIAVPYAAVVTAGATNVAFTRMPEMRDGVPIAAPDGTPRPPAMATVGAEVFVFVVGGPLMLLRRTTAPCASPTVMAGPRNHPSIVLCSMVMLAAPRYLHADAKYRAVKDAHTRVHAHTHTQARKHQPADTPTRTHASTNPRTHTHTQARAHANTNPRWHQAHVWIWRSA